MNMLREVSVQVAEGNLKVFRELAPLFLRFIQMMREENRAEALDEFLSGLKPGPAQQDGQDLLWAAFRDYAEAARAASEKERAQRILLANCRIGLHEQTRLQPHIEGAMDVPIEELFVKHLKGALHPLIFFPFGRLIKFWARHLIDDITRSWQQIATRYVMNLALPDGTEIPLGGEAPALPDGVPQELRDLELPELQDLSAKYGGGAPLNGARNWAKLDDRMSFIIELFRRRQQDAQFFRPPFEGGDDRYIAEGKIPPDLATGRFGPALRRPGREPSAGP